MNMIHLINRDRQIWGWRGAPLGREGRISYLIKLRISAKLKELRVLEIVLMERAVDFT